MTLARMLRYERRRRRTAILTSPIMNTIGVGYRPARR